MTWISFSGSSDFVGCGAYRASFCTTKYSNRRRIKRNKKRRKKKIAYNFGAKLANLALKWKKEKAKEEKGENYIILAATGNCHIRVFILLFAFFLCFGFEVEVDQFEFEAKLQRKAYTGYVILDLLCVKLDTGKPKHQQNQQKGNNNRSIEVKRDKRSRNTGSKWWFYKSNRSIEWEVSIWVLSR